MPLNPRRITACFRCWFRFSLRTMFVLVTLLALWLGWNRQVVDNCRATAAALVADAHRVTYWSHEIGLSSRFGWPRRVAPREPSLPAIRAGSAMSLSGRSACCIPPPKWTRPASSGYSRRPRSRCRTTLVDCSNTSPIARHNMMQVLALTRFRLQPQRGDLP